MSNVTFNYTLPDDNYDFQTTTQAPRIRGELEDLQQELRSVHKYNATWLTDLVTREHEHLLKEYKLEQIQDIVECVAWVLRSKLPHFSEEL